MLRYPDSLLLNLNFWSSVRLHVFPARREWRNTNWVEVESRTCQSKVFATGISTLNAKWCQIHPPPFPFPDCHLCSHLSGCIVNSLPWCLNVGSAEADWIIEQSTEESRNHWLLRCHRGLMLDTRLQNQPQKATSVSSIFTVSSAHRLRGAAACMEVQESRVKINKAVPTTLQD